MNELGLSHANKTDYGQNFVLTFITNQLELARTADFCGVQRIGVDLEQLNKALRQIDSSNRISAHTLADLQKIAQAVSSNKLFVRINSLHANSKQEIENVLLAGARYIMLPYFHSSYEVEKFIRLVNNRAYTIALVETSAAVMRIRDILSVSGLDEIMLGLNDLRLSFGVANHFEIMSSPIVDMIATELAKTSIVFTMGGVAPPFQKSLPIDPDLVLAQYPRLGASGAWLARSAFNPLINPEAFSHGVNSIRYRLNELGKLNRIELKNYRDNLSQQSKQLILSQQA